MPIAGRLADGPHLGDVVEPEVHVEGFVENVEPGTHRLDRLDRARMDLDAAAVADEGHDWQAGALGAVEHGFGGARIERPGIVGIDGGHGLMARVVEPLEHREELMRVGHLLPRGAQFRGRGNGLVGAHFAVVDLLDIDDL